MSTDLRLLIFGLPADTTRQEILSLLPQCEESQLELINTAGANDDVYAIVQLVPDRGRATRLAEGLNARRFHGRRLQTWVTAMAWT